MTWVNLSGAFGYGTKLTSTQQQNLRDNIAAMAAGDSGAPSIVEAALGSGAVVEAKLGASAVAQAKLKTSQGSVNTEGIDNLTLPGGEYGFYPQIKNSYSEKETTAYIGFEKASTSYITNIYLVDVLGGHAYAQQRYVTASGEIFWIFILRDKITKKIISMWQAPDHPCFGNGGKPELVLHPFGGYDPAIHEILVINPSSEEVKAIQKATIIQDEKQPNKDFLEVFLEQYEIDEISNPQWPDKKVTVGLPPDWDEAWFLQKPVQPIKKVIPKPDYVLCKSLKLKS